MTDDGDNRPLRYEEGTTVVYRASGLGACDRAVVAAARGHYASAPPEWMQEVFDEGREAESMIDAAWQAHTGTKGQNHQREVELEVGEIDGKYVIVRGHIDADDGTGLTLREYKKFRSSTWDKFIQQGVECNVNYPWQVAVYMHAGGYEQCEFVGGRVEFDEWNNMTVAEVLGKQITEPPFNMKAIRQRITRLERIINTGYAASEVECQKSMYPCPYWKLHDQPEVEQFELPEGTDAAIEFALASHEIGVLRKQMESHEKTKAVAAHELRTMIIAAGPDAEAAKKLLAGDYVLTRVRSHTPARMTKPIDKDYFTIKQTKRES